MNQMLKVINVYEWLLLLLLLLKKLGSLASNPLFKQTPELVDTLRIQMPFIPVHLHNHQSDV
jgi:hypothetical protein